VRIFRSILIDKTERMKVLLTSNATSSERRDFGRSTPRLQPRAIVIQALCMGIVLFDFLGAIMGLNDFVIAFWNHHPFLAIPSMAAAILLFAALIELGIESLRSDPV
jgi:hypothetical protein